MASSHGCSSNSSRVLTRCPHTHTHTHIHHQPHCPLRRHCRHCPLHNPHFYFPSFPQNPQLLSPLKQPTITSHPQISQEQEHVELDDEDEDDEPVFVLTDEWREFFAKSEARRKLAELAVEKLSMSSTVLLFGFIKYAFKSESTKTQKIKSEKKQGKKGKK